MSEPVKLYAGMQKNWLTHGLPALLTYADFLISADETLMAEWLLTRGMPGYYRDYVPKEIRELKAKLHRFMMNSSDYNNNPQDVLVMDEPERAVKNFQHLLRAQLIEKSIKAYNDKEIIPHIYEMGPGEYWLPIGLAQLGYKFTYDCTYLSQPAYVKAMNKLEELGVKKMILETAESPTIFVACEILEHLANPQEIVACVAKNNLDPTEIHVSTPLYTFGHGNPGWAQEHNRAQGGHLLTFTPQEFVGLVSSLFPQYAFTYHAGEIQSLVGVHRSSLL